MKYCTWCKEKTDHPKMVYTTVGTHELCFWCWAYFNIKDELPKKRKRGK